MKSDSVTSKTVTEIAWRIVNSAKDTCAAANSVLVHRQLIGELREALQSPDETTHDPAVACPAERDVRDIDAKLGAGWVAKLAAHMRSTHATDSAQNGLGEP